MGRQDQQPVHGQNQEENQFDFKVINPDFNDSRTFGRRMPSKRQNQLHSKPHQNLQRQRITEHHHLLRD